jgi:hypothetical protein
LTVALLLALVTPMRSLAQALNPTAPASLTTSPTMLKLAPHASADGQTVAFNALLIGTNGLLFTDRYALDLTSPCCEAMVDRLTLETETHVGSFFPDMFLSPSISADGRFVAYDGFNSTGTFFEIRLVDRTSTAAPRVLVNNVPIPASFPTAPGQLRPHPVISEDGQFVFYQQTLGAPLGRYAIMRVSTAPGTPTPENLGEAHYGFTQSPATADGSAAFGVRFFGAWWAEIVRHGSGAGIVIRLGTSGVGSGQPIDVTASSDGSVVAWSSTWNCVTGGFESQHSYVWTATPLSPDPPATVQQCDPAAFSGQLGGRVYRVPDSGATDVASRPFLTRDGRRLFFISTGNYSGANLGGRAMLHGLSLVTAGGAPEPWAVKLVSHVSHPQVPVPTDETVELATASADGKVVTYLNLKGPDGQPFASQRELRLVDLVSGAGVGLITEQFPPSGVSLAPALPFEANITTCTLDTINDTVLVRANLRQYRGGNRRVIVRFEADDGSGVTKRGGLSVQRLVDASVTATPLESSFGIDPAATQATCRVVVIDGAVVQPDVAVATRVTP